MQALTLSGSPLSITLSPAAIRVPYDYGTYHGHVTITNDSHVALTVTPVELRTGSHPCSQAAPAWLTTGSLKPFKLAAGHAGNIPYTVHATSGVNGSAVIAAMASAPKSSAGSVGGAVGMRVTVGTGVQVCTKPVSAPAPSSSGGLPMGVLVAIVVLAALVVAGVVFGLKRRHQS